MRNNVADMAKDPFYLWIEKTYTWHIAGMVALLWALGGWPYVVWGIVRRHFCLILTTEELLTLPCLQAVRAVWVYHITWFVNSAAHVWGDQEWNTGDLSRNNWSDTKINFLKIKYFCQVLMPLICFS